jgi:2-methylisocitrate lyase-like PEP mutase family enzyme
MASPRRALRQAIASGPIVVAPGAYDCVTARLIAKAGFPCVYMTGAGTSAVLGFPDYGLLTLNEMADNAGRIARAVALPVIADADTGYGSPLNVFRTVQEFEREGVAAFHLEDQVHPKRCGHMEGKEIVSPENFVSRIRAAVDARSDPDLVIIARTDAIAVEGYASAIDRANAAIEAGADVAFVEAPRTIEEVERVPLEVKGPCLINLVDGGKTPLIDFAHAERAGYRIAILPWALMRATTTACTQMLADIKRGGLPAAPPDYKIGDAIVEAGGSEWAERQRRLKE